LLHSGQTGVVLGDPGFNVAVESFGSLEKLGRIGGKDNSFGIIGQVVALAATTVAIVRGLLSIADPRL
jgi:hypothetical protein